MEKELEISRAGAGSSVDVVSALNTVCQTCRCPGGTAQCRTSREVAEKRRKPKGEKAEGCLPPAGLRPRKQKRQRSTQQLCTLLLCSGCLLPSPVLPLLLFQKLLLFFPPFRERQDLDLSSVLATSLQCLP